MNIIITRSTASCILVALLCSSTGSTMHGAQPIDSKLFKTIDGFPIAKIVGMHNFILEFKNKNYGKPGAAPITLADLERAEASTPPETVKAFLRRDISSFVDTMSRRGYTQELEGIKPFFDELVPLWSAQRNRADTILLIFIGQGKTAGMECDILCEKITSIRAFHTFLHDLEQFIGAVMASCPQSMAKYEAALNSIAATKS